MNNNSENVCEYKNLYINDILVWDKNPRYLIDFPLNFDIKYSDDTKYIKQTIKNEIDTHDDDDQKDPLKSFKDLMSSIINKGFINDNDGIFVKEIQENKYVVLEGNRRICAIKILNKIKLKDKQTIDWFTETFTLSFLNQMFCELNNYSIIEKIDCWLIKSNDIDYIKSKIYKRDQINGIGKKFWSRTTYFSHMLSEYKLIKEETHKNKINKLSILYDKDEETIKSDFKSACWVFQCLNIYKEKHKDFNISSFKSSALELSRSKIKDPIKSISLQKLFEFKFEEKSLKFIPEKKILNITTERLAEFLIESYKNCYYNTRGWKIEYNEKLIEFLHPEYKKRFADYLCTTFECIKKIRKDKNNISEFERKNFNNEIELMDIFYTACDFADEFFAINDDLIKIIEIIYEKTNKFLVDNNKILQLPKIISEVHFAGLIDAIYHELNSQQFLKKSTLLNFPYAKYSLLFRNIFSIMITLLFINEKSRSQITKSLFEINKNLCNATIVGRGGNIKNDISLEYINESDLCSPSRFTSLDSIVNSIFYNIKGKNVPGFFTWEYSEGEKNDIQKIFCEKIYEIFSAFYVNLCSELKIHKKEFSNEDIEFITFFIKNKSLYDTSCRFIHNDVYIVNAYNNSPVKEIGQFFDIACKLLHQLIKLFNLFT